MSTFLRNPERDRCYLWTNFSWWMSDPCRHRPRAITCLATRDGGDRSRHAATPTFQWGTLFRPTTDDRAVFRIDANGSVLASRIEHRGPHSGRWAIRPGLASSGRSVARSCRHLNVGSAQLSDLPPIRMLVAFSAIPVIEQERRFARRQLANGRVRFERFGNNEMARASARVRRIAEKTARRRRH